MQLAWCFSTLHNVLCALLYYPVGYMFVTNIHANVVCFLLGDSPASDLYMPTFRNTSAYINQTPGSHPKENKQHSEHGESLKSRIHANVLQVASYFHSSHYLQQPQPFSGPLFSKHLTFISHTVCHVLCWVWSERWLQGCHQLMHITPNIAVFHCHCNKPAPFWLSVLLPLH